MRLILCEISLHLMNQNRIAISYSGERTDGSNSSSFLNTWFVVAVMMLMGRVKVSASPAAKIRPHHGICTWSFMTVHSKSASTKETKSVTWNHQLGIDLYFFINLVWISSFPDREDRNCAYISLFNPARLINLGLMLQYNQKLQNEYLKVTITYLPLNMATWVRDEAMAAKPKP